MTNPHTTLSKKVNYLQLFLVAVAIGLLSSCTPSERDEFNKSVGVFFLGLFQVINMFLLGVPALIFSIISATNQKSVLRILGIIFLAVFSILAMIGFISVLRAEPKHFDVYYLFLFELVMLIGSILCLVISFGKKDNNNDPDAKLYNDLLDGE